MWTSPLGAVDLATELRLSDVQWDSNGNSIVWREERSDRGVLVCESPYGSAFRDLTTDLSVRAQVGYGGGDFTVSRGLVYFVAEGRLFRRSLSHNKTSPITPSCGQIAAPVVSPDGRYLVYVHSTEGVDVLATVDTAGANWPAKLSEGHDFYMQPCWHRDNTRMAWIGWDHPHMPWDSSALYLAELTLEGALPVVKTERMVAGGAKEEIAVFQPAFSPDGCHLSYVSNANGWFNLYLYNLESKTVELLVEEEAEHGLPAWVQGLRTYGWTANGSALYFLRLKDGFSSLVRFDLRTKKQEIIQSELGTYSSFQQISVSPREERVALIASSPVISPRVITGSRTGQVKVHRRNGFEALVGDCFSRPKAVSWSVKPSMDETDDPTNCHGLYYPPLNPGFWSHGLPPAIIKIHGGPTSQYRACYEADTQFFTSRGFAVLELNYRGSSGYGRAYMEVLKGRWGVLDVEDAHAAAVFLVESRLADPDHLAIMGGSAGGYTVLMSLITHPGLFRAGVCRYGVSNLFTLALSTHKFEQHYLDFLVGTLPKDISCYRQRSPIFLVDRIQNPLAVFQGDEDQVVPRSQSDEIVQNLARRGVPHLYRVFKGEGHGWRKSETIRSYYKVVEAFLKEHLIAS